VISRHHKRALIAHIDRAPTDAIIAMRHRVIQIALHGVGTLMCSHILAACLLHLPLAKTPSSAFLPGGIITSGSFCYMGKINCRLCALGADYM